MKLSFEEIRQKLWDALNAKAAAAGQTMPSQELGFWIESVYEDELIYCQGGKLFKAPWVINDSNDVSIGEAVEVEKKVKYQALFSDERLLTEFSVKEDGDMIVRSGKLFEAGEFPDKGVKFDENDISFAVDSFAPVENDLEHASTILDGKLGSLKKVWKKGEEIFGDVAIPKWLDKAIGNEPIKVSLAFDRHKRIVGNALVLNPRISDAVVMSAFSRHSSTQETFGKPGGTKTPMKIKLGDAIKHLFGAVKTDDLNAEVEVPEIAQAVFSASAPAPSTPAVSTPAPVKDEAAEAQAITFKAVEKNLVNAAALVFADSVIRDKKALPAQREQIAAMFGNSVELDANGGSMFSANGSINEGSQVKAIRDFFANAPAHAFGGEAIPDGVGVVHFGGGASNPEADAARMKDLLSKSPLGQQALGGSGK